MPALQFRYCCRDVAWMGGIDSGCGCAVVMLCGGTVTMAGYSCMVFFVSIPGGRMTLSRGNKGMAVSV